MVGANFGSAPFPVKEAAHGIVGGAFSVAQGGNFFQGFAANSLGVFGGRLGTAAFGSSNPYSPNFNGTPGAVAGRTLFAAIAGGTGSAVTGGKFAAGAAAAAIGRLFNQESKNLKSFFEDVRLHEGGARRGHAWSAHVGKNEAQLRRGMQPREVAPDRAYFVRDVYGTFFNHPQANALTNEVLNRNRAEVLQVGSGSQSVAVFSEQFGFAADRQGYLQVPTQQDQIGRYPRTAPGYFRSTNGVRVVIRRNPEMPLGVKSREVVHPL